MLTYTFTVFLRGDVQPVAFENLVQPVIDKIESMNPRIEVLVTTMFPTEDDDERLQD